MTIPLPVTENEVNKAYKAFEIATVKQVRIMAELTNAKKEFELKKAIAIANGEIEGKNEAIRDGLAAQMFQREIQIIDGLQNEYSDLSLDVEVAKIELNRIRTLLNMVDIATRELK